MNEPTALASLRALRNQILAKLEQNEDFRVLRGVEFVLAKETRLPQGGHEFPQGQTVQPGARAVQEGLQTAMAPQPYSVMAAEEHSLSFLQGPAAPNTPAEQESKPLDFPKVRTAS